MRLILIPIIAGFLATAGITAVLWLINRTGWTNADMVRAVGSLFTRSRKYATRVGFAIHFTAGIIISGVYLHVLSLLSLPNIWALIFVGSVIGFVHGFVFSFIMVIFAEHHPVEIFQEADFEVAIAHVFGHIVYGMIIGLIFGILQANGIDMSPGI